MGFLCITNNNALYKKYKGEFNIKMYDFGFWEILIECRDMVHIGYKLLTHPLSGSVKPNETPVKTIFLADKPGGLDYESLAIIENSIITYKKFAEKNIQYNGSRQDFELVDLALAESALQSLGAV